MHLHVGRHVSHHVGHRNVVSTLCEVSETLTEWKSEIITYGRTGVGANCVFKNHESIIFHDQFLIYNYNYITWKQFKVFMA